MKRFYFLSIATLVAGIIGLLSLEATAAPNNIKPIPAPAPKKGPILDPIKKGPNQPTTPPSNTTTATGGAGGSGAQGGAGGGAVAVGGNNTGTIINGNNNTINNITKVTNNNISFNPSFGGGSSGGGSSAAAVAPGIAAATAPSDPAVATDAPPAEAVSAEVAEVFTRRFVKVKNDADVPMKVFVQYRGMDDKKWAWLPADPTSAQDALVYDLKPGQEIFLEHKNTKVSASRIRIWGAAQSQSWLDYRDQDLWIVPEIDQRGEHHYLATEMKTFTFVFPKHQVSADAK